MRQEAEMERWGAASIFEESSRLLHKHYRLFLPFFLAFYIPISIAGVFQTVFLPTSSTPLLDASVVKGIVNTALTADPPDDQSFTSIFSWTLLLIYVLGTLGTGAISYITACLYIPTDTDDDQSIVPKVFQSLPHAFLRMFITQLWTVLAVLLLSIFSFIIGGILYAIMSTTGAGWTDPKLLSLFVILPELANTIFLSIVLPLAQVIAVLEPGNYGREALKRSTRLVRFGRAWTIVVVSLTVISLSALLTVLTQGIGTWGMPVWAKVVLGVVIEGLDLVFRVYFEVVSVVMYFVYKARLAAAWSADPGVPADWFGGAIV